MTLQDVHAVLVWVFSPVLGFLIIIAEVKTETETETDYKMDTFVF